MDSGKAIFYMVKNWKTSKYPEGNCKMACDRMVAKYPPKISPSLLKLKIEFKNIKLENVKKYPEDWISDLELTDKELAISEKEFMVKILNIFLAEYNAFLMDLRVI